MSDFSEDNPDVVAATHAPVTIEEAHDEPVLVFDAPTNEEAEVVRATLEAAGIPAVLHNATVNPFVGAIDAAIDRAWTNGVFVAPSNVEAARAILNEQPLTEAELTALEEADPTTLEEAEARVRNAE